VVLLIAKEQDVLYEGCDILISRINSDKLKNTTMHTRTNKRKKYIT